MENLFLNGSVWLKADFHLHTRADKEFSYLQSDECKGYPPKNTFCNDYVNALKKAGTNVGVITNHNKFDAGEFKALKKKAAHENFFLLRGVELSVNEGANGVHTLIVFSEEWDSDGKNYIDAFLSSVFSGKLPSEYENENGKTTDNLLEIIKKLDAYNKDYFSFLPT